MPKKNQPFEAALAAYKNAAKDERAEKAIDLMGFFGGVINAKAAVGYADGLIELEAHKKAKKHNPWELAQRASVFWAPMRTVFAVRAFFLGPTEDSEGFEDFLEVLTELEAEAAYEAEYALLLAEEEEAMEVASQQVATKKEVVAA